MDTTVGIVLKFVSDKAHLFRDPESIRREVLTLGRGSEDAPLSAETICYLLGNSLAKEFLMGFATDSERQRIAIEAMLADEARKKQNKVIGSIVRFENPLHQSF